MDWVRRGLRFKCQSDCGGKCCTGSEREGSVFLEGEDIGRLATSLRVTVHEFIRRFAVNDSGTLELRTAADGGCVFLNDGQCQVYDARPLQCRVYPFFPLDGFTPIESRYTWAHEKKFCPGIGKGRLYKRHEIENIMRGRADVEGFDV